MDGPDIFADPAVDSSVAAVLEAASDQTVPRWRSPSPLPSEAAAPALTLVETDHAVSRQR